MASRLPRSCPSAQNVAASGIVDFLNALAEVELHSLMLVRHGKVIAEGWWRPYLAEEIQLGYSLSKSVTSVALGYALDEGLFGLDDPVVDLFDTVPDNLDPRYSRLTVRDLARMTTGHHRDRLSEIPPDFGWPELDGVPGEVWIYDNWATWKLAELIQLRSGRALSDYLEPRLFEPLDIEDWAWLRHGETELGYSGLHLSTESWAKFGHLLLRGGELWDRQVIPADYLSAAITVQADTSVEPDGNPRDVGPDWKLGYGYQFWAARHGYRGDGAFGQLVCVLPDQDAVLVTTAASEDIQPILDAAWDHLLPAFRADARGRDHLGASTDADASLATRLNELQLPPVSSRFPDQAASFRSGPRNEAFTSLRQIAVSNIEHTWEITLWLPDRTATVHAGDGLWINGEIPAPDRDPIPVGASAGWTSENLFEIQLRNLTSPHGIRVVGDVNTGKFDAQWLLTPLHHTEFTHLGLPVGLRHRN